MATIKEDYVSFETAKLLKEKGFDELTSHYYIEGHLLKHYSPLANSDTAGISAPTLQMAMKWLRLTHNIHIYVIPWYHEAENPFKKGEYDAVISGWGYDILDILTNTIKAESSNDALYLTPEQATDAAIKYCLENLI